MLTLPRRNVSPKRLKKLFDMTDCKRWVIGKEVGKSGYEHYQVRVETSADNFPEIAMEMLSEVEGFIWYNVYIGMERWYAEVKHIVHIEEANEAWDYEMKGGNYITSWEKPIVRRQRFGKLTEWQETVLERVRTQNDRQIDVWYDPSGNHGKTWLAKHVMETGQGLIIPRADMREPRQCCDFIYRRWRPEMEYLIFDIPRTYNVHTKGIYELIEEVKDGLIFSTKYEGGWVNISGVKVIVFTNNKLDEDKLSFDRWRFNKSPPKDPPLRGGSS